MSLWIGAGPFPAITPLMRTHFMIPLTQPSPDWVLKSYRLAKDKTNFHGLSVDDTCGGSRNAKNVRLSRTCRLLITLQKRWTQVLLRSTLTSLHPPVHARCLVRWQSKGVLKIALRTTPRPRHIRLVMGWCDYIPANRVPNSISIETKIG